MYARQVGREEDDLAQELRVRVWRAIEKFDSSRSTWMVRGQSEALRGYVFLAITNKIRDYKRDAAREKLGDRQGKSVNAGAIEDYNRNNGNGGTPQEWFDAFYNFTTRDEVYGEIENEPLACPAGLTTMEHAIAAMLALGYDRDECAIEMRCTRSAVNEIVASLRRKLVDRR